MFARVLSEEFVATERLNVVIESIDGLRAVKQSKGLNRLQAAALDALERLHARYIRQRGAVITHQAMARPVAVAQAAMEAAQCLQPS